MKCLKALKTVDLENLQNVKIQVFDALNESMDKKSNI